MKLCFATNNANKLAEIQALLASKVELLSLLDIGCKEELAEDQATLEGNSLQKAQYIFDKYEIPVFADDTGLEIKALNGEPGVYSARYAGPERDMQANIELVRTKLKFHKDRSAQFRTVITLILNNEVHQFEGIAKGSLISEPAGTGGFGYDPIFVPEGYDLTFAEMSATKKNEISHRAIAIRKLVTHINNINFE